MQNNNYTKQTKMPTVYSLVQCQSTVYENNDIFLLQTSVLNNCVLSQNEA